MPELKKPNILIGICPKCHRRLEYVINALSVNCGCCDNSFLVSEIKPASDKIINDATGIGEELLKNISTPEVAISYLETFFNEYDWKEYLNFDFILIPEITAVVEKLKMSHPNNFKTWELEFISVYTPFVKKIEGIFDLEKEMVNQVNEEIFHEDFKLFDLYRGIIRTINASKIVLLKVLEGDLEMMNKYGAQASLVAVYKKKGGALAKYLSSVLDDIKKIEDIPCVSDAIDEKNEKVAEELAAGGIDASAYYHKAVEQFEEGIERTSSLSMFQMIRDYKDSKKYIMKLNKVFSFQQLYIFAGRRLYCKYDKPEVFKVRENDIKNNTKTFSFYEIEGGMPARKPIVKNISCFLANYGAHIYYIKKNKALCSYNLISKEEIELDIAKHANDYVEEKSEILYSKNFDKIIIKKKLSEPDNKNHLAIFRKKQLEFDKNNNFSLLQLDLKEGKIKTIVKEIVDVMDFFDDVIFYTYAKTLKEKKALDIAFMSYNIETHKQMKLLDSDCEILDVFKNFVIYSLWTPNQLNKRLYILNVETQEELVLEENIKDFIKIINDKIYYTVGNELSKVLCSIDLDGQNRQEIMSNASKIKFVKAGWIYVVRGTKRNKALIKISLDGTRQVVICTNFQAVIAEVCGNIYYTDFYKNLHMVRSDGKGDKIIANGLASKDIIIDYDTIYYCVEESISANDKQSIMGKSLYKMDISGKNITKIAFDIKDVKEFDDKVIYFSKKMRQSFEVTIPISSKMIYNDIETYDVEKYYMLNRKDDSIKTILAVGLPTKNSMEFRTGCLRRKVVSEVKFKPLSNNVKYERKGRLHAGDIYSKSQRSKKG